MLFSPITMYPQGPSQPTFVVNNTMGAALVGVICAAVLYGVSSIQTLYYFGRYRQDKWYIKFLVGTVWILDSIHQGLISHTVYHYVVTNYSNPDALLYIIWSILLEVLFNGLIALLVQCFLLMRVWRLSNKNVILSLVVACLVVAEFACSVVFTIKSLELETWAQLTQLKGLSMTVNVLAALGDVLITSILCVLLHRSRTGFKRSDTIISRLIMFTVNTGLLTSVCAVASLVSIIIWGQTLIYVAFYFSLGRLYSNSLLATLNARKSIRSILEESDNMTLSLQTMSPITRNRHSPNSVQRPNISIKIDTTQEFARDHDIEQELDSAITDKTYTE